MVVRELVALLGFETDEASLRNVEKKIQGVATNLTKLGTTLTKTLTVPLSIAATAMIKLTSDAIEMQNKFDQVFKDLSISANSWSENLANNLGRSSVSIKEGMSAFQAYFIGLDFGRKKAYEFTKQVQQNVIDFASFHNITDKESLARFISGLSGSAEVFDRFGINLKASALDLELQALGLAKSTAKATEQQKVIARLSIIQKAMTQQGVVGDAIRTKEEFANRIKTVRSRLQDMAISFGRLVIPVLNKFLGTLIPIINKVANLSDNTKRFILILGTIAALVGPILLFGGKLLSLLMAFSGPLGIIIAISTALAFLVDDIIVWVNGGDSLLGKFLGSWVDFKSGILNVLNTVKDGVKNFVSDVQNYFEPLFTGLQSTLSNLLKFIGHVFLGDWEAAWIDIKDVFTDVWGVVTWTIKQTLSIFNKFNDMLFRLGDFLTKGTLSSLKAFKPENIKEFIAGLNVGREAIADVALSTGEKLSVDRMQRSAANKQVSQTVSLQPVVNVEIGSVSSRKDAQNIASEVETVTRKVLREEVRKIQTSFPVVE